MSTGYRPIRSTTIISPVESLSQSILLFNQQAGRVCEQVMAMQRQVIHSGNSEKQNMLRL
jgi:hypothetical protein